MEAQTAQHTPGPWRINRSGIAEQHPSTIVSDGKATGYICHVPPRHEDAEANARLIAAAPELAEAADELQRAADAALGFLNAHGIGNIYAKPLCAAIAKANAALAKAR